MSWTQKQNRTPVGEIDFAAFVQNHGNSLNFRGFVLVFYAFRGGLILRCPSDPSRDPYGNSERLGLESTGEEIPHCVRRPLLHGGGDVGVSIQGEPSAVAARTDTITIGGELPQRQLAVLGGFDAERGDQK